MTAPVEMEANGFRFTTEARATHAGVFGAVFHVLSFTNASFDPPIAIFIPGKWKSADDAHRAAQEYAVVMADDGALQAAVNLRQTARR